MRELLRSRLSPFRYSNFNRFFFVQTLSMTGSFAHDLARAYIVIELMSTAGALGSLMMAIAIPSFLFILQGGVLVDRIDVRKMMMWTKGLLGLLAVALGFVILKEQIQFWHLLIFGIIEGAILAFDSPAYQALTVRLVPREEFQQALALNSTNFHASRMLGPLLAGFLMAWWGPASVFFFDGITYVLLVFILGSISLEKTKVVSENKVSNFQALKDGLSYSWKSKSIRYKLMQLLLAICIVFPMLMVVFRTYVQHKFSLNAEQFGYVFTLPSLGSMFGAFAFMIVKPRRPIMALFFGVPMASLGMLALTYTTSITQASLAMALTGFCMYLSFASLTVSMHLEVLEEFRGRLGSLIGLCFISIGPFMSFPVGILSDWIGFEPTIRAGALLFFFGSVLLYLMNRHLIFVKNLSPEEEKASQAIENALKIR